MQFDLRARTASEIYTDMAEENRQLRQDKRFLKVVVAIIAVSNIIALAAYWHIL